MTAAECLLPSPESCWRRIFWVGLHGQYEAIGHINIHTGEVTPPWHFEKTAQEGPG